MPDTHIRATLALVVFALTTGQGCSGELIEDGGVGGKGQIGGGGTGGSRAGSVDGEGGGGGSGGSGGGDAGPGSLCPAAARWVKRYGDAQDQVGLSVAADPSGAIFIAGVFAGSIDLGGGPLVATGPGYSIYVAKLDPSGNHLWSHAYAGGVNLVFSGTLPFATLAVTPSGRVILGGDFAGTVDFGAGPVTAASSVGDGFLVAFDPGGEPVWSVHYGDPPSTPGNPSFPDPQTIESITVDPSGAVVALGYRGADFGGGMFLVKLDAAGNPLWRKDVSSRGTMDATVRADPAGNVLVSGIAYGPVDFGGGPLQTSPALGTFFHAKMDAGGAQLWSAGALTEGLTLHPGNGAGVDASGNLVVAGGGPDLNLDVGCGAFPTEWGSKVAQFDAVTGDCRWQSGFGDSGVALAVGAAGDATVVSDPGDELLVYPDSGLAEGTCAQTFALHGGAEVQGLAPDGQGGLLMTGGFSGTMDFSDDLSQMLGSAGLRDVFVARF